MRPVRPADRGPAVEDIQRRLSTLDYDLGPTGVDGVFLGATLAAVRDFQRREGVRQDGIVGPETWARLVDATFTLGDRLLYLRFPYLHGRDVSSLQGALNALGFSCGEPDGIFGTYTELGVRDFQRNTGLHDDGIAGLETVRALRNLEHVWRDKEPRTPFARTVEPVRAADVLATWRVAVVYQSALEQPLALRMANTALAACEGSKLVDVASERAIPPDAHLVVRLASHPSEVEARVPVVDATGDTETIAARVFAAAVSSPAGGAILCVVGDLADEHVAQRMAVRLLDGLCAALSTSARGML